MNSQFPKSESAGDDETLVRGLLAGDARCFERLMRKHNARLFRIARSILGSEAEAEDAMQDTYIQVYTQIRSLEEPAAFSGWAARIGARQAIARANRRRRANEIHTDDTLLETEVIEGRLSSDPERSATCTELRAVLEAALDALPRIFRAVVVLRMVEGMSVAETARALDIPEDTVKTRLFRGREALRARLGESVDEALREVYPFVAPRCDRVVAGVLAGVALTTS